MSVSSLTLYGKDIIDESQKRFMTFCAFRRMEKELFGAALGNRGKTD
jgi:hypothetical protein